jgi:hypothetical protein
MYLEECKSVRFRLLNNGKMPISARVLIDEKKTNDECLVVEVSPSDVGLVMPGKFAECDLTLYARQCGTVKVAGVTIYRQELDQSLDSLQLG